MFFNHNYNWIIIILNGEIRKKRVFLIQKIGRSKWTKKLVLQQKRILYRMYKSLFKIYELRQNTMKIMEHLDNA
jgi:hypothetical protein